MKRLSSSLILRLAAEYYDNQMISKRLLDILLSSIIIILFSPLLLLLAILIKQESKGPIFLSQARVGKKRKIFTTWKFRSIYNNSKFIETRSMKQNKVKNDLQFTKVGYFIHRYAIDELLLLWNVLIGDMSLVGPYPPLPSEVSEYTRYQHRRLAVTPGITGIWQISGRSEILFEQQVEMDLEYIKKQSFGFDLAILLKTIPALWITYRNRSHRI